MPIPEGPYAVIDEIDADPVAQESQEMPHLDGVIYQTHNYTVTYNITAHRGRTQSDLVRMVQAFAKPVIYDKYFPTGSPFAFSSASTVARIKVPQNLQTYEIRSTVLLTFNVCFIEADYGEMEKIRAINASMVYHFP